MNFGNFNNIVNFGNNFSTTFGDFSDDIIDCIGQFNNIININGNNGFNNLNFFDDSDDFDDFNNYNEYDEEEYKKQLEERKRKEEEYKKELERKELEEKKRKEEEYKKELERKKIEELTKKAQKNWIDLSEKYSKISGIKILQLIGSVIKSITFLQSIQTGNSSKYSLQEQVKMYEILQSNENIVSMLCQAHEESLRREAELKELEKDEQTLKLMKEKEEEKKKLEGKKKKDTKTEKKTFTMKDLQNINDNIESIERCLKKVQTDSEKEALNSYHQELLKNKNEITEYLNELEKKELEKKLKYDTEKILKEEEKERLKLIEEENRKIELLRLEKIENEKKRTKEISINEIEKKEELIIYRKQKICKPNEVWTDDVFKPIKSSLNKVNSSGKWVYTKAITKSDIDGWESIKWLRADSIFPEGNYQVFYEGISPDDILQGNLGDCYFLSAIASLAKFPKLIENLFYFKEKSLEHCYGVNYRVNGTWKLILLDDYFPCYGNTPAFSHNHENELWVMLLEKAWAKLNGTYSKAIGGWPENVFKVTTSGWAEKIATSNKIWNQMLEATKQNFLVAASSSHDTRNKKMEEKGIVAGHAYSCLGVQEVTTKNGTVKLVHLRNPWGYREWNGDWCDSSKKWTDDIRKQCGKKKGKEDDGSFWMSFADFIKYYDYVDICHLYDNYTYKSFHIRRRLSRNGPVLTQLEILNDDTHIFLTLHQRIERLVYKNGTYPTHTVTYFILFDSNSNIIDQQYSYCAYYGDIDTEQTLKKGIYYIISDANFRYINKDNVHGYTLSAYSSHEVKFSVSKIKIYDVFKKVLYSYSIKNLDGYDYAGGVLYQNSDTFSPFPFSFLLFENNNTKYDVILKDKLVFKKKKCGSYYLEPNSEDLMSLDKKVSPNEYEIILRMPWAFDSEFTYQLNSSMKAITSNNNDSNNIKSNIDDIINTLFNEEPQILDNEGYVKQYIHKTEKGYYIGLENSSKSNLNLKLIMEGLFEVSNPKLSTLNFTINSMNKRVFSIKEKPNYKGNVTFMFDYA